MKKLISLSVVLGLIGACGAKTATVEESRTPRVIDEEPTVVEDSTQNLDIKPMSSNLKRALNKKGRRELYLKLALGAIKKDDDKSKENAEKIKADYKDYADKSL